MINKKGLNFVIEAIFVFLLLISVVIGMQGNNNIAIDQSYLSNYALANDVLVIFSEENTKDLEKLEKIMAYFYPNKDAELYLNNNRVFGDSEASSYCLERSANIFVDSEPVELVEFKIRVCN